MQSLSGLSCIDQVVGGSISENVKQGSFEEDLDGIVSELPCIQEIVGKVLEVEFLEYQSEIELEDVPFTKKTCKNSYWEDKKELYLKFEKWIRENSERIPTWQVAGPLNYGMSQKEMKDVITKKLSEMVISGNLITEGVLNTNYNRETFYPTSGSGNNNLTRIWGAEFLRSNLLNDGTLNAAEHFLIIDDSATEIEVKIWFGEYPCLGIVNNAYVLSQKIEGIGKAWAYSNSLKLLELKYKDFSDSGNIICDANGIGWIVDTEMKSFDFPKNRILDYLKRRFMVLSGENYTDLHQTFKISVRHIADLILNS